MDDTADFESWLRQLECPDSYISNHAIKRLQSGVLGLLWEDLMRVIKPFSEVSEIRKNILLYKLKNEPQDTLIQDIRSTVRLKEEQKKLDARIKSAEDGWNKQELLCRQKVNLLEKTRTKKENLVLKKQIFKVKHEQMLTQIENCKKMQEICSHLMPPTIEELQHSTIIECLELVSNYSGGPDKRKVWDRISKLLSPIKIPVLYNALLAARSHYTNYLIHLDLEEDQESTNETKATIESGIAKICSEHLSNVAKRFIYNGKGRNSLMTTITYVEKIEQIIENERPDLNDWLPLTLEVRKLEILQAELQNEIEELEEQLPVDSIVIDDSLMQLIAEIKTVDSKTADCVQEIQKAFGLLKTSGILITKTRESLASESEKFQLLQTNEENQGLNIDLNNELNIFQNNVDINSLRKIMLKGDTGAYKHLQTCLIRANTTVNIQNRSGIVSNFPMLRVPVFYLVDFYKTFVANILLDKRISEECNIPNESPLASPLDSPTIMPFASQGILEILRQTDLSCKRTLQHSEEFEQILKTWSNQTVRDAVSKIFRDKTVYGATLEEWQKRFSMIVYILQKSNINIV